MPSKLPQVIRSIAGMQTLSRELTRAGKRIGFVPTMGALHEGHASLIRTARKSSDLVVTSIFVNPTQFAPHEDLKKYPRQLAADRKIAGDAGSEIVFAPKAEEVYPIRFQTWVEVHSLTQQLEGAKRPTHFRGVTTIVAKLFNIVHPDLVVFGMKDFQQAMVLRQMTSDLGYPMKFVIAPTVRERDGLALSSRNRYLDPTHRAQSPIFYQSLKLAKQMVRSGEKSVTKIEREMRKHIAVTAPLARIDYFSFNRMVDLQPVKRIEKGTVLSGAIFFGTTRLIDNLRLA